MAGGPIKQMLEMKLNFIKVYLIILTVTKEFYWKKLLYSLFFGKCKGNYFFSSEKNKPREKKWMIVQDLISPVVGNHSFNSHLGTCH